MARATKTHDMSDGRGQEEPTFQTRVSMWEGWEVVADDGGKRVRFDRCSLTRKKRCRKNLVNFLSRECAFFRSHLRAHVHAPVEHATHTRITLAVACTNTTYAVFCNVVVPKAYTK